jgi:hypothetical protein
MIRVPRPLLVLGLAWLLGLAGQAAAQAPKVQLQFGHAPTATDLRDIVFLRPNVAQELFFFVKNDEATPQKVKVQLLSNGEPLLQKEVTVAAGKVERVNLGKPPEPGKPAPKPEPLEGALSVRLLDDKGATLGKVFPMEVTRPSEYIEAPTVRYVPPDKGRPGRLVVRVKAAKEFAGPPARVELLIRPDRIDGYDPTQPRKGVYGGNLSRPGEELFLVAEDLRFKDDGAHHGPVYLTIDGYDRAFTFNVTFPPAGGSPTSPPKVTQRGLALNAPPFAAPKADLNVGVEVDNAPSDARVRLDVRSQVLDEKDELVYRYSEVAQFQGDRQKLLLFAPTGPHGGLLFQPQLRDWDVKVNLSAVFGETALRVRMLDDKGEPVEILDSRRVEPAADKQLVQDISLDPSAPKDVRFILLPKSVPPGQTFTALATSDDAVATVDRVVFFVGKPGPDGKLPVDPAPVPGVPAEAKNTKNLWTGDFFVPSAQKDFIEVSVQFIKKNKLVAVKTARVAIGPAVAAGGMGKSSITGQVVQGGRPQPNVLMTLRDTAGVLRATTRSNAKGEYQFRDLDPGSYRITGLKTADNTRGTVTVAVGPGEQKVLTAEEAVRLLRRGR